MKSLLIGIASIALAATIAGAASRAAQDAERQLKAAMNTELVDGNLKLAIEQYKKVAESGNRALAAQALLRMAECYQKLGDAEAQTIYERLVRDYGDQKDAAASARARLGATRSDTRVKGDRSIWTGREADGFGTVTPDGRFLTYTDWDAGGTLMLRDLASGTNHRLTSGGSTQFSAISKDGKHVAYQWRDSNARATGRGYELRVAKLQPTGISESRRLVDNEETAGTVPYDWSPDGKWIAATISRKDATRQIALVAVQDGSLRVLKSLDWREPTKIFFSPDGRHIAYELPVTDSGDEQHVFVMAVDGSRESTVAAHPSQNVIMGWSPDGQHVLFSSNRSGSFGLWAVPVEDGRPRGAATLVKPDIASSWSLGLTASGTMFVWKYASPVYLQASSIDLTTGKLVPGAATFQRFIGSRGRPDWSRDGKHLAYQSCDPLGAGPCTLWIRSVDTGEVRELKPKLGYFFFARWSPDGRELLTRGSDLRGRNNGLYRIDVQTGEATLVVSPFAANSMPQWAPDGKHAIYRRGSAVIERNLATNAEREVVQIPGAEPGQIAVSPDGHHVAYRAADSAGASLFVMPLAGGAPRLLLRVTAPDRLIDRFDWTADGRAIVIAKERGDTSRNELWLAPITEEKPRKLDIDIDNWLVIDGFRIDRAGKQIAFVAAAGKPGLEIRALENFLPAQATAKPTAKK